MKPTDFRFSFPLRVRWVEVDMQKIVFNAHYLTYADTAFGDYWRALGLPYEEAMHRLGGDVYLKKASVQYNRSAQYDDRLDIALRCARIGTSSMNFECGIFRGAELLVSIDLVYVFADPVTQTSKPVPPALRQVMTEFEAGRPVLDTHTGTWSELGTDASALRHAVFAREQGIPAELMVDEADAQGVHVVARNRLGQPVATGRLITREDGVGQIGRLAVHRALRGTGLGLAVLQALVRAAEARGDREVMLHAQKSAIGFYEKAGYSARGNDFEEAGIAHREFFRAL
jgi:YbgC/YbaW family acyl-CoA thioester hydrolase